MARTGMVGQTGEVPFELYLRKQEMTCVPSPPVLLQDFQRQVLKETGTQAPLWASDEPRTDYQSAAVLSLRHDGARDPTDPWVGDNKFLDFEFAYRDSRPVGAGPDFRAHVEQQKARGKYIMFGNDSDLGIPESGISGPKMYRNIRNAQERTKRQWLIFEDSKTGFHTGGGLHTMMTGNGGEALNKVHQDQPSAWDPLGFELPNRRSLVTKLSNEEHIGWRSSVDHEFKVAKYGYNQALEVKNDSLATREKQIQDHEKMVRVEDMLIPQATASMIVDLARVRSTIIGTGYGANYSESLESIEQKKKIVEKQLRDTQNQATGTATISAHQKIDGIMQNVQTAKPGIIKRDTTVVHPKAVEMMIGQTRKTPGAESLSKDARDKMVVSIRKSEIESLHGQNKNLGHKKEQMGLMFQSVAQGRVAEHRIFSYKGLKPVASSSNGKSGFDQANQNITVKEINNRRLEGTKKAMTKNSTANDGQNFGREHAVAKLVGPMGNKFTRESQATDHVSGELMDI